MKYYIEHGFANAKTGCLDNPCYTELGTLEQAEADYAAEVARMREWWNAERMCANGREPSPYEVELIAYDEATEDYEIVKSAMYSSINHKVEYTCETHDYDLIRSLYAHLGLREPSLIELYDDVRFDFLNAVDGNILHYFDGGNEGAVYLETGEFLTDDELSDLF